MTGQQILDLGNDHLRETYILGAAVPKNNASWKGPWDCAEFVSWIVFQLSGRLYGCNNNLGNPATADAYTGYWRDNAEKLGKIITFQEAMGIPGAAILRVAAEDIAGHIVISDGEGGTVEARSHADGVVNARINNRRWDFGILVPWCEYAPSKFIPYTPPSHSIYRYTKPMMISSNVGKIQKALQNAGFNPNGIDNIFGLDTLKAIEAFQQANNLVVDGEVGKDTAEALGVNI